MEAKNDNSGSKSEYVRKTFWLYHPNGRFSLEKRSILPFLDVMFETFGPDRLMFGSDWPVCLSAGSYETGLNILEDYLTGEDQATVEKVFGGNAIGFYNVNIF